MPARFARWIHTGRKAAGEKNERNDYQSHQGADYQAEKEGELIFAAP